MATKKVVVSVQHSVTKRVARSVGEAVDGHTDIAIGWQVARHPAAVEARAVAHQRDIDSYLDEVLAEYAS